MSDSGCPCVQSVLLNMRTPSLLVEKRLQASWTPKPGNAPTVKNPVVRSKSYNIPVLTPVIEFDLDSSSGSATSVRRHSVCEMPCCLEESSPKAPSASRTKENTRASSLASSSPPSVGSPARTGTGTVQCPLQTNRPEELFIHVVVEDDERLSLKS